VTDDDEGRGDSSHDVESWLRDVAHVPAARPPGPAANTTVSVAAGEAATLPAELPADRPLPQPGEVLDQRYRLDGVLGSGGMGVVYTATQLSTRKQVAIKWMRPREGTARDQTRAAERFVREARAAARIHHPNVVDVYDVCGGSQTPYLVMERLHGESLRERLTRGPVSWDELVALLAPVMSALDRAHAAGVVHRDLKPDNLFLATETDGSTVLKVLDFGVSRLLSHEEEVEISLTRTGAVLGTPVYMPLEQLRGEPDLDGRTDVYAMGVVLYEALCGERPFPARNAAEYGAMLATSTPRLPSKVRPELKGAREGVVMKALARDRQDRFASMEAFRVALLGAGTARKGGRAAPITLALLLVAALAAALLWRSHSEDEQAAPVAAPVPRPAAVSAPQVAPASTTAAAERAASQQPAAPPTTITPPGETAFKAPRPARRKQPVSPAAPAAPAQTAAPLPGASEPAAQPVDDARMKPDEF
jgi:hypothetical protein